MAQTYFLDFKLRKLFVGERFLSIDQSINEHYVDNHLKISKESSCCTQLSACEGEFLVKKISEGLLGAKIAVLSKANETESVVTVIFCCLSSCKKNFTSVKSDSNKKCKIIAFLKYPFISNQTQPAPQYKLEEFIATTCKKSSSLLILS